MIELTLPLAPSSNLYKRAGRVTRTKAGKLYQSRVNTSVTTRFYYEVWMLVMVKGVQSLGGAILSVELNIYPASNRRMDIDNRIKVTLDALQRANVFDDDSQIHRLVVNRMGIIRNGQIICRISPL